MNRPNKTLPAAVTLVVAYHLDVEWARGGFLGVDLFFVISGFLITTLLLREHDSTGRLDLGSFWTRRFRRLVPPLVVMTAATVAASRVYSLPEQWSSIRWDARLTDVEQLPGRRSRCRWSARHRR